MIRVITLKNQTVFDIAIQHYGDVARFNKVMELNPELINDYSAATDAGVAFDYAEFDMAYPLAAGQQVVIDPTLTNAVVLRELRGHEIISFDKNYLP